MKSFKRMSKLRFLHLDRVNLTGSFEHTLENLRWLCWDWCPLKCLPSDFYPQKLVILELPHSKMRVMWEQSKVGTEYLFLLLIEYVVSYIYEHLCENSGLISPTCTHFTGFTGL